MFPDFMQLFELSSLLVSGNAAFLVSALPDLLSSSIVAKDKVAYNTICSPLCLVEALDLSAQG